MQLNEGKIYKLRVATKRGNVKKKEYENSCVEKRKRKYRRERDLCTRRKKMITKSAKKIKKIEVKEKEETKKKSKVTSILKRVNKENKLKGCQK